MFLALDQQVAGSISAWAEEPWEARPTVGRYGVDLRVGGGAFLPVPSEATQYGRSPRGRRSPDVSRQLYGQARVDLRVGGGALPVTRDLRPTRVDLRVGGAAGDPTATNMREGRSPRGRRSLCSPRLCRVEIGSISAWAEEPVPFRMALSFARVDLRVGGGAPRGRSLRASRSRSISAWAEERDADLIAEQDSGSISAWAEEPNKHPRRRALIGSISAWAEEPRLPGRLIDIGGVDLRVGGGAASANAPSRTARVDLRVGGGALVSSILAQSVGGRSPRGRRSLAARRRSSPFEGRSPRGRRSLWRAAI